MARPVSTSIPHSLGKDEARRRIEAGFATIERQICAGFLGMVAFQNRWEGDRLHFEGGSLGQKITGRLDILANSVEMEIDLPEMIAALADRILAKVKKETQLLLEKK